MGQITEATIEAGEAKSFWQGQLFRLALLGLGIGIGLAALFLVIRPFFGPSKWHGMEIQATQPVTNFTLTGSGEQPVSLVDFRGKVVMLYFGYTFCPDVCPATMVEMADAMEILGSKSEEVQVVMVTLDPERDTAEVLEQYVSHFDDSFIGLTGTAEFWLAAPHHAGGCAVCIGRLAAAVD